MSIEITDATWKRALNCAHEQLESHFRQGGLSTKDARRAALDDALQHAVGIILVAASNSRAHGQTVNDK